ncbi:MAG: hypothetical protein EXS38_10840 [Opitutus sp.]|nr:hypothetical protein [Opitutus sp.]
MRRTFVLAATLIVLWAVVTELNHGLTGWRGYLFVGGLYAVFAALLQPFRSGFATTVIGGLICDAHAPTALFGTHALLFALAHVGVFHLRDRIPRDDTAARIVVSLLTNLALFLLFSFTQIHHSPAPATAWPRLFADLVGSQVFVALVTPWLFALQSRALVLAGVEREMHAES